MTPTSALDLEAATTAALRAAARQSTAGLSVAIVSRGEIVHSIMSGHADLETRRPVGQTWAYANHGYGILGLMVQDVVGAPFAEHMRTAVLRPLGMTSSGFDRSPERDRMLAVGYTAKGCRHVMFRRGEQWGAASGPAGALTSTTTDMARFAAALLADGEGEAGRILARIVGAVRVVRPVHGPARWSQRHCPLSHRHGRH